MWCQAQGMLQWGLLVQVQCDTCDNESLPVGQACLACHLEASAELGEPHSAP